MGKYKPYSEYKDSGVEWLGDVPEGWDVVCGKRVFSQRREVNCEDEQLAASQVYGVIPQKMLMELTGNKVMLALNGTSNFRRVKENDFVISLRSFEGGIEYSGYDGCVSPAYTVLKANQKIVSGFFKILLKSKPFIASLQASTDSLRDGKAIPYEQFGRLILPVPSLKEQTQIAAFLDHEAAKIDRLIKKQEKLIELLKEKRQAVISHAVTKGLNADAPMKDSGVEWLGEVPEHWEVKPLGYLGVCQNGINIGADSFGSGFPFVSYSDVYKNRILPIQVSGLVESTVDDRKRYSVEAGDVFFTRTSESVEEIGFVSTCFKSISDATFAGFLIRFRPNTRELLKEFSAFYFSSQLLRAFFVKEMNLVTRASLSQDLLKRLSVPIPPREEQERIASNLEKKDALFSKLLAKAGGAISVLKERRTALISAAVTGKIDVRDWNKD